MILLLAATAAFSHPHVAVDYDIEINIDPAGKAVGYYVTWTFDPLFSQAVIYETDRNRDGVFQAQEVAAVRAYAFENTGHFDYFTQYTAGALAKRGATRVEQFWASIVGRQVHYRFLVPFSAAEVESITATGTLSVWVADPTYYSAFIPKNPPAVPVAGVSFQIGQDSTNPIEYAADDAAGPLSLVLPERIDFSISEH